MSKIPVDRNGKTRSLEIRNAYPNETTNKRSYSADIKNSYAIESRSSDENHKNDLKEKIYFKPYTTLIPKINFNMDKVVDRNPRILDLREKLNEISKKQEMNVDKKTKSLLNDITQQLVEDKEGDDSGPYSLLFDIDSPSTSTKEINDQSSRVDYEDADLHSRYPNKSPNSIIAVERQPNVLNFDNKPMNEFEYSCEKEFNPIPKKTFNTHSRSDLCLQLKSHIRNIDTNSSPNENSMTRNNEENSLDDSLGILTPDQMDDICYLENSFSPTVEGLPIFCGNNEYKVSPDNGDTPSTDKTESNSAASTIQNDCYENTINLRKSSVVKETFAPIATIDAIEITSCDNDVLLTYSNNLLSHPDGCSPQNILRKEEYLTLDTESCQDISVSEALEEEFLPSIHGSILEPASSMADTTVNMEIPLDIKNGMPVITNRIEQTPSPEDLPLDNSDVNGEISTYSQFSSSTLHDSQTYSDSKSNDYTKSMETSKVSNSFITSITSITSLDGYQGDGEMSRPVSRSAEHNLGPREEVIDMDWQNIAVPRRVDPMTDSDFFTESDADGFDEQMQRGDRRAQVIDGALYGGKNKKANQPLIVNRSEDSCMESSGVYTDFENQRASPVFLNVINDMSPASTISSRSDCSQKKLEDIYYTPLNNHLNNTLEESDQNIACLLDEENITPKNTSKRNSIKSDKSEINTCEKNKEEKRSFTLKKYKMPKRDVPSKLKTMLQSRKSEVDNNVQNSPKTVKKTEKRESFLKKNVIDSKTDYRVKSYKDIKSKVDCSFSLQRSQTSCSVTRIMSSKSQNQNAKPKSRHMRMRLELGSAHGSGKSSLHSSQSDISATSSPAPKHTTARFPLRNGKKREPTTPANRTPTASTPQPPPTQAKKNGVVQKLSSSPVAVRPRTSLAPPPSPRKPVPNRTTPQRPTTLPATKEPPRVATAVGPRGKRAQTPQQAARSPPAPQPAPAPAPLIPLTAASTEQADALAHAAKGVEALGVLVQYLVFRLDALNGSSWRVEAERWRGVAAAERSSAARADRDRQQRAQKDLDTIAECLSKISELEMEVSSKEEANARLQATHIEEVSALANDVKGLKDTIDSLKHEVAESRTRLHAHSEIERTLRAQLAAVREDVDQGPGTPYPSGETGKKYTCDAACDPICWEAEECELRIQANEELSKDATELAAEVRSLRSVVELKQAEVASLRDSRSELAAERERRAAAERDAGSARQAAEELRERGAARQREVDRLRDDNRRLREVAARDRDHAARLLAHNEELRYKLRQKSQVVSLLAGGAYVERSGSRPHTCSSGDSSPPASPPASPSGSPSPLTPPLPAVKGVVEKHDSVSWVLEIEETPEEMASRLARKSSFRSSTSSGVKRRGEGSPAPASPAPNASKLFRPGDLDFPPPPPPLKEAAGEAIYIYDEGHY